MKRSEIWSDPLCAVLLVAACQAPDAAFFDRPVSPRPMPPVSGAGTPEGTTDGETGSAGPATGPATPDGSDSPGSRPVPAMPSDDGESTSSTDVTPPSSSEPDVPPAGDDAPNLEGPSCVTEACVACRDEGRCEAGLLCHPQRGLCVPPCTSGADCDAAADTPICTGTADSVIGVCVECETDLDCVSDDLPACDATGACVECTTNEHCADQGSNRNVCNAESALCVECVTAADCDSDNPVCVDGECEEED